MLSGAFFFLLSDSFFDWGAAEVRECVRLSSKLEPILSFSLAESGVVVRLALDKGIIAAKWRWEIL